MRMIFGVGFWLGATAVSFGQAVTSQAASPDGMSTTGPAMVQRADGSSVQPALRGSQFETVALAMGQAANLQIPAALLVDRQPMTIEAEDGGTITQGKASGKTIALKAVAAAAGLGFQFQPGSTGGWYRIRVTQGEVARTFEFWVGPLPPRAEAGPTPTDLQ